MLQTHEYDDHDHVDYDDHNNDYDYDDDDHVDYDDHNNDYLLEECEDNQEIPEL